MNDLANQRILVVEDEFLISAMLCDMLEDASVVAVGPAATVAEALKLIEDGQVDAAILDMNLQGQWSDPVAEELQRRGIPFVFTSGYGANERSERFRARAVAKPYSWEMLEDQLRQAIQDGAGRVGA
ncbi:MAG: response regulator [Acetobacteraceae bacterium]|nr:MAG: response regulator [Acetobacteraceae bacterium]